MVPELDVGRPRESILRLEQISKDYGEANRHRTALRAVSLELARGEIVGVFGRSGSGKTTLLRIAAGLATPDEGTVLYDGERLDRMSASQLRRHRRRNVGCVWAGESWTPGMRVVEHVELPLLIDGCEHRTAQRLAHKFLLVCEAEQCADLKPEQLSDGERQRVAIARALVIEPRLLVIDGVVSGLSIVEQEAIMTLLASLARQAGVAVLVADTGAGEILRADRVFYLRDGQLAGAEPTAGPGKLYRLPSAGPGRLAADA